MSLSTVAHLSPAKSARKKRPSWSPGKSSLAGASEERPRPRTPSEPISTTLTTLAGKEPATDIKTSSLNFPFSFWDETKVEYRRLEGHQLDTLLDYLHEHYSAIALDEYGTFLGIQCETVPPLEERPFLVADAVAVWSEALLHPLDVGYFGSPAAGEMIVIPQDIADDIVPFRMPSEATMNEILSTIFPQALAVAYITQILVVELLEVDPHVFLEQMDCLPESFSNSTVPLFYNNGPIVLGSHSPLKKPKPQYVDGESDDTDYVKETNCFYPGATISSNEGKYASAGIAVSKGSDIRVTVPFHTWDKEFAEHPEKLGDLDYFKVFQGKTCVGNVTSRVGESDIGLATLMDGIYFSNSFLDVDTIPARLLASKDISMLDKFLFDSCVTGQQPIICLGTRKIRATRRQHESMEKSETERSQPGKADVGFNQVIYATNAPEITSSPRARDGVGGSAMLRVRKQGEARDLKAEGQVGGFMLWSHIRDEYDQPNRLLCFCEPLDDLIYDGWEVAKLHGHKRGREDEEEDSGSYK